MKEKQKETSDRGFAHVVICEEYEKQTKGGLLAKIEEDSSKSKPFLTVNHAITENHIVPFSDFRGDCDGEDDIADEAYNSDGYDNDEYDDGDGDGSEENKEFDACDQKNTRQKRLLELYSLVAEEKIKNQLPLAPVDAYLKSNLCG
ncbi:unnamed protein product [Sphenostylis stenocarpa]|uniref:Uncharacterized protein n=1 Tax=Sphenostylis stenocarpa TaxID=92480 RepID=A0AA86SV12_9FABA|nr:unnamed protein product [Sphenostylis stenocarpa]